MQSLSNKICIIGIWISKKYHNLRSFFLSINLSVNCGISNQEGNVDILDCNSDELSGKPVALLLDKDDIEDISGLPEDTDPSKSTYNLDLSNPNLLKTLNNLPNMTIESIDGSTCYKYGNYTITGTYEGGSLKEISNVEISFGSLDSSGLCQLKVNGNKVVMECHNKEKFDMSIQLFYHQKQMRVIIIVL